MEGRPLLDELMANAWPPLVEEEHGGWRYRWAEGVTRRANSAMAQGADGTWDERVEQAEAFYRGHGAPTLIQVSTASAPPALAQWLEARGYRSTARTLVQAALSGDVATRARRTVDVVIADAPTDEWFRAYWSVEAGRGRAHSAQAVLRSSLLAPRLPTAFAAARRGSQVIGVGQMVIERGWGGIQCMATDPSHRRQGVARTILEGLAEEAVRRGVGQMYLAALADNDAAIALYEGAGFRTTHEYSYFTDPPD